MTNENQKSEHNQENEQATTPATQVELTDEELGQVVGGVSSVEGGHATIQPDPTAVE